MATERGVARIGFGAMRLSGDAPFRPAPSRRRAFQVLDAAASAGINFVDTADTYGLGHNEDLLGHYLRVRKGTTLEICTKVGQCHDGAGRWSPLGDPRYLRQQVYASLQRLGVEHLAALLLHRVDPDYPADEQVGVLAEFLERGQTAAIGVSGVNAGTLRGLVRSHPITFVQNRQNLETGVDHELAVACAELRVTLLSYAPLALGGRKPDFERLAERWSMSPQQLSLRWALSRPDVLPIPGSTNPEHVIGWNVSDLDPLPVEVLQEVSSIINGGDLYAN